jgi:hypothetical protein
VSMDCRKTNARAKNIDSSGMGHMIAGELGDGPFADQNYEFLLSRCRVDVHSVNE